MSRGIARAAFAIGLIVAMATPARAAHPWLARRPPIAPPPAHQLRDLARWPAEPAEPTPLDPARFRHGIDHLCARSQNMDPAEETGTVNVPKTPPPPSTTPSGPPLGDLIAAAAAEAGIDPFLLAGLMFVQSGCHASHESRLGEGLLRIQPALYRSPGAPPPPGDKSEWQAKALLDPASNLRLGAKLIRMWSDTHVDIDASFGGVPHRGPIAHFIWGDVVRGSGAEDQVLTARRRLIAFYQHTAEPTATTTFGLTVVSPLEGAPRVASSGPGEDREGGKRRHRGIDLAAAIGEPVRAVADGTVMFAGANIPSAPRDSIAPARIARYRWRRLGAGGIYVCIEHAAERHIVSCYMHLDIYNVSEGDKVTAGQPIGRVGRTGVQVSPPHLHFELRIDDRIVDPARQLGALVIPPKATQTHRLVMQQQRMRIAKTAKETARAHATPAGAAPKL